MNRVGIVVDSTCDVPPEQLAARDVRMVPLKVLIGEESFLDWIEITPAEFYERQEASPVLPKTSQPSPADFEAVYRSLAEEGCDEIVSIHLSSAVSGTISSATLAAKTSPVPVHIVDTRKVTQAIALILDAALDARDAGADGAGVAARAEHVAQNSGLYFIVDTLDYLVKGGRIGKASGMAASLLNIKPVLQIDAEGFVAPFKKVKGRKKAITELAQYVAEYSKEHGRIRLALLHACAAEEGRDLLAEIESAGADFELSHTGLVGAVIGTYVGRNALGCAFHTID